MDTHLHLTRIFLPRRSLSTTSIMRAVAYPSGRCVDAWKKWPRGWPPPLFVINFPEISTEPIAKRSSQRSGSATSSARDRHADPKRPAAHRAAPRVPPGRPRAGDRVVQSDIRVPQQVRARPPAGVIPVKNAPIQSGVQTTTHPEDSPIIPIIPIPLQLYRYARNVCSLIASQAESNGACQLDSAYGTSRGRVAMAFGETNCEVTLTGCVPGVCYSFRDATSTISRDDVPRPGTAGAPAASVFKDVAAVEGTSSASFTNDGFSFKASAATVKISGEWR